MGRTRIEWLEGRVLLSASLIKDLNLNTEDSNPSDFVALNGVVYFADSQYLYRTDGTSAGTSQVSTGPQFPEELTLLGNQIFFASSGGLWKLDGSTRAASFLGAGPINTTDGNRPLHNSGALADNPRDLTPLGSILYFAKPDGAGNSALWRSDGTQAGTIPVAAASQLANPDSLTNVDGTLFFHASDAAHGDELWKTDGTAAGTMLVKDIFPGTTGASLGSFTNVNGTLFFTANDGAHGLELWKSNGTAAGTAMVKDINPGPIGSAPSQLTNVNGALYFVATDGVNGYELWKSDGTASGTAMVANIDPGAPGGGIGDLTAAGSNLFFTASTPAAGTELWISNGSAAGTKLVKDIWPGAGSSLPSSLLYVNGTLYFHASDSVNGGEFWKSDGTAAGTVLVKDIQPGAGSSRATGFTYAGGWIYFAADNGSTGMELWKSDGTTAGTSLVRDINPRPAGSNTGPVVDFNGIGYFSGYDGIHGQELWRTDGTAAGTYMVRDITPGSGDSNPTDLTPAPDALYFVANSQLYKTDGTSAGTVLVTSAVSNPANLTELNGEIFFSGSDGGGQALWVTDGTPAGTVLLRHFAGAGLAVDDLTPVLGTLFFAADDGVHGMELWSSDGTPVGTQMVSDINPGPAGSGPWNIIDANGAVMFVATDGVHGYELWESDGTAAGTFMLDDINPGPADSQIDSLTYFQGEVIFTATDGVHGDELWVTDGTPLGTTMLTDINPGAAGSSPTGLTVAGSYLYFSATGPDGTHLWETQGYPGSTIEVPSAGQPFSTPISLTAVGQKLAFVAKASTGAWQVYQTDGQVAAPIASADPSDPSVHATNLGSVGNVLYFTADNHAHGPTLWMVDLSQEVLPATAGATAPPPAVAAAPAVSAATSSAAPAPPPSLAPWAFAYDSSIFANEPNLGGPTMPSIYVAYSAQIFPPDAPPGAPVDPQMIRTLADTASSLHEPLVIDLEINNDDARYASQGHVRATLQQLIQMADLVHQERPDVKVGFYGNLPPVYYSADPIPNPSYTQYLAAVQQMLPLLSHVDFVCPVLYDGSEDPTAFNLSAQVAIGAVAQLGKPVLPFFSMTYQGYDPTQDLVGRPLPAEVWQSELQVARSMHVAPIIWGGWPRQWNDNSAWWAVTREMQAEADAPNPTFTPDVPFNQPNTAVSQITIDFGVPVTGFSVADLSLTVDGGPNLLGRGQSLTTTDNAKWTLGGLGPITSAGGKFVLTLRNDPGIRSTFGYSMVAAQTASWSTPEVVGRYVFYNDSSFDGNSAIMNAADAGAIAPDKTALLPGMRGSFANYTSYSNGLNGIMIDVAGLTGTLSLSDFDFRIGNDNNPAQWQQASSPNGPWVAPEGGVNGSTRLEFVWPDGQIRNTWMQITVKADANTGLSTPDVFYFGNAIGESGNSTTDAIVDNADVLGARNDPHTFANPAPITNVHDYNRDGRVDATDQLIAQQNQTTAATALRLIGGATFSQLLVLAQNYGGPGRRAAGDYNGDSQINFADLLLLAQNYGPAPAAPAVGANLPAPAADPLLASTVLKRKLRLTQSSPQPADESAP